MTCYHCGFACNARGKDMTRETFDKAIALDLVWWVSRQDAK